LEVRPKKHLGQHFLRDQNIAEKIVRQISPDTENILEIGPGTGILTKYLLEQQFKRKVFIDTDRESIDFLKTKFPEHSPYFIAGDFLKIDLEELNVKNLTIIGNLPYNISSQIFFRVLEYHHMVNEMVCMIQKEVAERIASGPGSKKYGILSVLLQVYYDIEIIFRVSEHVFNPPPKVKSAVIRLRRNDTEKLSCDEETFALVVKKAFNQRRKTLRNSLSDFVFKDRMDQKITGLLKFRPEQLQLEDFIYLAENVVTVI